MEERLSFDEIALGRLVLGVLWLGVRFLPLISDSDCEASVDRHFVIFNVFRGHPASISNQNPPIYPFKHNGKFSQYT